MERTLFLIFNVINTKDNMNRKTIILNRNFNFLIKYSHVLSFLLFCLRDHFVCTCKLPKNCEAFLFWNTNALYEAWASYAHRYSYCVIQTLQIIFQIIDNGRLFKHFVRCFLVSLSLCFLCYVNIIFFKIIIYDIFNYTRNIV